MKILWSAAALALLAAGPAAAQQMPQVNIIPEIEHKTPEQKEQDAIRQKAYQDSLRKIPNAKASNDPWGTVRGAEVGPAKPKSEGKRKTAQPAD